MTWPHVLGKPCTCPSCKAAPRPWCGTCPPADYKRVDRALVIRESADMVIAICHCHGATMRLELGPSPTEGTIADAVAFPRRGA